MAEAVPERHDRTQRRAASWLARDRHRRPSPTAAALKVGLAFVGDGRVRARGPGARPRAVSRAPTFSSIMQECGPRALGIVSLISFLIGLILGFVGAVQLQQFGASIFVANLVAVAMTREIGCIMTAIVMAGPDRRGIRRAARAR